MLDKRVVADPFGTVDASADPSKEESILLNRAQTSYYREVTRWFFDRVFTHARPETILEVGCGTGDVLDEACRRAGTEHAKGVGIDLSNHLVSHAENRFPNYVFQTADGRKLPFDGPTFDLVFIATVLVHTDAPEEVLNEAVRVTKPGGMIAVLDQDFETATLYPGQKDLTRRVLNAANDFWANGWIGRKLPSLFHRAGLRDIDVGCFVRIDRSFDAGFFQRIRDWIVQGGFPEHEAKAWYDELCTASAVDEFIFTRNFFSVTGKK